MASSDVLAPRSYADAHRYDGAAIHHDRVAAIVPCALQPRDVAIIRDVSRYKFLSAPQILELWWPDNSVRAGQRRLSKLFEAGHLERFRPIAHRGSFPWVYHLGA
ncbi:MAG: replication-relaxation family protein [Actinomycetota bacterium]|nr:replication-relaxation family protein [Actinomycetota bacterium]